MKRGYRDSVRGGEGASAPSCFNAFSLLELLVAMVVLVLFLGILLSASNQSGVILQRANNQARAYQSARFAFDLITRTLSQSTLNVYYDYDDPGEPAAYIRKSDLHFVIDAPPLDSFEQGNAIFFQAPLGRTGDVANYGGLPGLLNAVGYYVTYGKDPGLPPFLQALDRNRFRLMQYLDPSEDLGVYSSIAKQWFSKTALQNHSSVIADNVILLLFWPRLSEAEDPIGNSLSDNYLYDSRLPAAPAAQKITTHQQPPLVEVTLVAIDESDANRLPDQSTPPIEITEALEDLFQKSTRNDYASDLASLEGRLAAKGIGYRVLTRTVALRESKWTK